MSGCTFFSPNHSKLQSWDQTYAELRELDSIGNAELAEQVRKNLLSQDPPATRKTQKDLLEIQNDMKNPETREMAWKKIRGLQPDQLFPEDRWHWAVAWGLLHEWIGDPATGRLGVIDILASYPPLEKDELPSPPELTLKLIDLRLSLIIDLPPDQVALKTNQFFDELTQIWEQVFVNQKTHERSEEVWLWSLYRVINWPSNPTLNWETQLKLLQFYWKVVTFFYWEGVDDVWTERGWGLNLRLYQDGIIERKILDPKQKKNFLVTAMKLLDDHKGHVQSLLQSKLSIRKRLLEWVELEKKNLHRLLFETDFKPSGPLAPPKIIPNTSEPQTEL